MLANSGWPSRRIVCNELCVCVARRFLYWTNDDYNTGNIANVQSNIRGREEKNISDTKDVKVWYGETITT